MDERERLEQAVKWCTDNLVTVRFISVHGHRRVQIYAGGYGFVCERDNLPDAVDAAKARREQWRGA